MKMVINCSTLYVGGGVQVALSFIDELKKIDRTNEYHIFLSPVINHQINQNDFSENFYFYLIEHSPASLKYRKDIVTKLKRLEKKIKPNIIFSIFGPSYWRPKSKHIMGFAIPWLINPKSSAYMELSFLQRNKDRLKYFYQKFCIRNNADFYIVETEDTKNKLSKIASIDSEKIYVIGNTVSRVFFEKPFKIFNMAKKEPNEFRFITISHHYAHKNLKIIKSLIPFIKDLDKKVKFFLTLDDISYKSMFLGLEDYVVNLGPVNLKDCPSIYEQCDALFLPTLLECFSASYPEAMKMKKPILTSNYSFAKDVCSDAALYFNPLDVEDIANKIRELIENKSLQYELIKRGEKQLKSFETATSRAKKYIMLCEKIVEQEF